MRPPPWRTLLICLSVPLCLSWALLPCRFCLLFVSSSGAVSVFCCSPSGCPVRPETLRDRSRSSALPHFSQSVPSCPQMGCVGRFFFFRVHLVLLILCETKVTKVHESRGGRDQQNTDWTRRHQRTNRGGGQEKGGTKPGENGPNRSNPTQQKQKRAKQPRKEKTTTTKDQHKPATPQNTTRNAHRPNNTRQTRTNEQAKQITHFSSWQQRLRPCVGLCPLHHIAGVVQVLFFPALRYSPLGDPEPPSGHR